jgi:hypothetical protein
MGGILLRPRCAPLMAAAISTVLLATAPAAMAANLLEDFFDSRFATAGDGDSGSRQFCPPVPCPPRGGAEEAAPAPEKSPQPSASGGTKSTPPAESESSSAQQQEQQSPERTSLEGEQAGATGGQLAAADGGYLDDPIPGTRFRFRADGMFDDTRPDRAEFIYGKCGCFRNPALLNNPSTKGLYDPTARGPVGPDFSSASRIDYQELSNYLEVAWNKRFSIFVEVPVRFVEFQFDDKNNSRGDTGGLSDINAGFKYAWIACPDYYLTSELRVYAATGDSYLGLGTGHTSIEPGLLFWRRLSERVSIQGELRDWVPLDGTNFAGNVIRYGGEFGYDLVRSERCCSACGRSYQSRLTAVGEIVGWTVFNGQELTPTGPISAAGDTIVNLKLGPRLTWGGNSVYVGWGHALTGDAWYRDMVRLEYVRNF